MNLQHYYNTAQTESNTAESNTESNAPESNTESNAAAVYSGRDVSLDITKKEIFATRSRKSYNIHKSSRGTCELK